MPVDSLRLTLRSHRLTRDDRDRAEWTLALEDRTVASDRVALLLCDVWDRHWCRGATERLDALVPRMDAVARRIRDLGGTIVHAPSDTLDFYSSSLARARIEEAPPVTPSEPLVRETPPLPIDDSDGGADTGETPWFKAWTRQHPGIAIDESRDVLTDRGEEVYRWLRHRRSEQLLVMGVHTNMCVLGRSFGIKQMVSWGVNVALIRDLTDTMYNPERSPYVSHDDGTRLVVEYIEKFWCPTIASDQIVGG